MPDAGDPPTPAASRADFPKSKLEDALGVPEALQRNGGQPLTAIDLAAALRISPGSSTIRTLAASSSAYALTGGGLKSQVTMRDLGAAITQPTAPEERVRSLVTAALTPDTFRSVYDYYKGKKFPERQFFENTVQREFNVDAKQAARAG